MQNDIPLSIEHRLPRLSDRVEKSYNTINRNIVRRIDFIEINKDRFVEIPKSIVAFCEKNNIQPPEENEYLHYVD